MIITITIVSTIIITVIAWMVKKTIKRNLCPICVGVSLTWLWLLIGQWSGQLRAADYQLPTAILMGGTVVGLMSKLEKFITPRLILVWKTAFVISGFLTMYSLLTGGWLIFTTGIILALVVTLVSLPRSKEIEEKMKNCC